MHPMLLVKESITQKLQNPNEMSKFAQMKMILSQYRGKSFRSIRRQAILQHKIPKVSFQNFEANWLQSLKKAIQANNR